MRQKLLNTVINQKNIPYYLTGIGVFLMLKIIFIFADNNDLLFLLQPTNYLIEFITNTHSQYLESYGYFNKSLNILIDKSCSGFNFLILSYIMLVFLAISRFKNAKFKLAILPLFLLISCFLTIFINSSRILVSVVIRDSELNIIDNKLSWLHQLEGSFVYFFFLIIIYMSFEFLFKISTSNCSE